MYRVILRASCGEHMAYSPHYQHVFSARNAEIGRLLLRIIDANHCFKVGYRQDGYGPSESCHVSRRADVCDQSPGQAVELRIEWPEAMAKAGDHVESQT